MSQFYFYLVLLNAVVSLAVALAVFWKNRYQAVGPLFGSAMAVNAIWLVGFAQYFRPLGDSSALVWAGITLTASILSQPLLFHSMIALVDKTRVFRWWIVAAYVMAAFFIGLLWSGQLITGLKAPPTMHHYVHYSRTWYPFLGGFYMFCQWGGGGILTYSAFRSSGYKRTQLIYFIIAWLIAFLATNSIILPLEYNINIQPVGFFVLPMNLSIMAYVLTQARLMQINLAVGKVVIFVGTLAAVMLLVLAIVGIVNEIDPKFLDASQTLFVVALVVAISAILAFTLPRFGPYVEQVMRSRLFGDRYRYQQGLSELISRVATIPDADELLQLIVDQLVELMKVPRALVLMQEDTTTDFVVRARASLQQSNGSGVFLAENTEVIQWLRRHKRTMVKEEVQLREPKARLDKLTAELKQLGATLCVPMVVDNQLVGTLALDNKLSGDMFIERDIRLLESLCAEVALAVRYRKFEQQILQTSKLASLGTLAAGIAHEIRNPLSSIKTFVQLLPTRPNDAEFQAEFSQLVSNDVDRITKIVENVLSFARSTSLNVTEQRIEAIIEDSLTLIKSKLKHGNVELTKEFNQLPPVRVDKDQMSQVIVNIVLNAVEALPQQGGKIKITCSTSLLESPRSGRRRKTPHMTIEIADNGPGIPDNIKSRLFDPFFTTKPQGTGLGLAITYKVVEVHGGFITIDSEEGKGAAFKVHLPL